MFLGLIVFLDSGCKGEAGFGPFFTPGYELSHLTRRHGHGYGHHHSQSYGHRDGYHGGHSGHRAYGYGHSYGFLDGLHRGWWKLQLWTPSWTSFWSLWITNWSNLGLDKCNNDSFQNKA